MKKSIMLTASCIMLACYASFAEAKTLELKASSFKGDCSVQEKSIKLPPDGNATITVEFDNEAKAKENQGNFFLYKDGDDNPVDGKPKLDAKKLVFTIAAPFKGNDETALSYKLKDKKGKCHSEFIVEKVSDPGTPIERNAGYFLALGAQRGVKIDFSSLLKNVLPDENGCCSEDGKVLCASQRDSNRIQYDAYRNILKSIDHNGDEKEVKGFMKTKAGRPLAFEVINLNHEAFKVEITDTMESDFQETSSLLKKFFGTPLSLTADAASVGEETETDPKDLNRAALYTVTAQLGDFLSQLKYACLNKHNSIYNAKIMAKKQVDAFFVNTLKMTAGSTPNQFISSLLDDKNEADTQLAALFINLYTRLNAAPYRLESFIPQVSYNKDRIIYTFNVHARDNTPYLNKVDKKDIVVHIVNKWKVDVSSGFYLATALSDQHLTLTDATDTIKNLAGTGDSVINGKRIITEKGNKTEFGFSSLIHYSYKFSPSFACGVHIGAGVSLNDRTRPRYFAGTSFLFGNNGGRLALNLGIAGGNVKELSNSYTLGANDPAQFLPSSTTTINYVDKFKTSFVVGLTYNLPFNISGGVQKETPAAEK